MPKIGSIVRFCFTLGLGVAGGWLWRDGGAIWTPPAVTEPVILAEVEELEPPADEPVVIPEIIPTVDLMLALQDGMVTAEFRGNGIDTLRLVVVNRAKHPIRLAFPLGQAFESTSSRVMLARPCVLELAGGEARLAELGTFALSSTGAVGDQAYVPVWASKEKLQPLLEYLEANPEFPLPAAQTAALALLENLPAVAFAKYVESNDEEIWNPAFKVDTVDLIKALMVLREIGGDEELAITLDPRTRIEAMLDPLASAYAARYYGIRPETEWTFWRNEVQAGNADALKGIARYYPEVALQMLPEWVRETRTRVAYRLAALEALVATEREEALNILREMQNDFDPDSLLGKKVADCVRRLETVLGQPPLRLGFRVTF